MIYHQIRTCHRLSTCDGYICTALPVRSVVVAVLPFSVCISVCISNLLIMHSKSRHIARAKKRTRKACTAIQNPKKVRRELFFLARRPSERVSAFARVSFLLRSLKLLVNGFFSLLKPLTRDVCAFLKTTTGKACSDAAFPTSGGRPRPHTPHRGRARGALVAGRAHSLGSSRSRPRKTRIFSFFFFLECALSLSSLVFFFFVVVVFQLKHAVEEEKPQEENNAKDNNKKNNNAGKRRRT